MKQLILHIPHASTFIPCYSGYLVEKELLSKEMLLLTDWHTDDLFEMENCNTVCSNFSRIFCDVERFADDEQEVMAKFGMGAIYENFDSGEKMRIVSKSLRNDILKNYYQKHHETLNKAVSEQLARNENCLIIDCHSFSYKPFSRDLIKTVPRPDFCIGTDEFHTPQILIEITKKYLEKNNYSVEINFPYSGTLVPLQYYQKNKNVFSIMIEVNRKLYLNDNSNEKNESYFKIKDLIFNLLKQIENQFFNIK